MKRWKIDLKANDEEEALIYLKSLMNVFKAAALMKAPMDHTTMNDPDKNTGMICDCTQKK